MLTAIKDSVSCYPFRVRIDLPHFRPVISIDTGPSKTWTRGSANGKILRRHKTAGLTFWEWFFYESCAVDKVSKNNVQKLICRL